MRSRQALALIAIMLLATFTAQSALCQEPGESFETAPLIKLIPGEVTAPESGYYILNANSSQHCFKLEGLKPGYKMTIEIEVIGIEQGRGIISLYKESGELVTQRKIQYGSGTSEKINVAYQPSLESGGAAQNHYLTLGWYSGSMKYRLHLALEDVEDYAPGMGDAGSSPDTAPRLPDLSPGKTIEAKGYLASADDGGDFADHVDYYLIRARLNSSKSVLRILIDPVGEMRLSASLFMGDRRLTYGSSKEPGGEIKLDVSGEWKPGDVYEFAIRVDNLADRSGGAYLIHAWIEEPNATEQQKTEIKPPGGLDERILTMMIMAGAAALIAISILMIFLRRRRIYRVEEVGWWGLEAASI
jgi:hypothetical protein